jgi:hypothetical protein
VVYSCVYLATLEWFHSVADNNFSQVAHSELTFAGHKYMQTDAHGRLKDDDVTHASVGEITSRPRACIKDHVSWLIDVAGEHLRFAD